MLNLASNTDPAWTKLAVAHVADILLDHAHCEKKAAGAAVNLLFRYPERRGLQIPLAQLAREELSHFERVLAELAKRGIAFARQRPSAYGGRLHGLLRSSEPDRLVDLLLVSALIEARSCERFRLLAEALPDAGLAALYRELLASEARHHQVYVELAASVSDPDTARARLRELAEREAEFLASPSVPVRLHS